MVLNVTVLSLAGNCLAYRIPGLILTAVQNDNEDNRLLWEGLALK